MRILFCNFHTHYGAGHDTYLLSLIKALQKDHSIALAGPASSQLYQRLKHTIPCFAINYKIKLWKIFTLLKQFHAFKRWLEIANFDIIHVNGSADHRMLAVIYLFLKKKPKLVFTKHNSLPIRWGAKIRMRYFSDAIIAVSQFTRQQLILAGIKPDMIKVIANGIDTDFFSPISNEKKQALRKAHGLSAEDFIFVSNAGTANYKNWPSIICAIAALPSALKNKVKVVIAGQPPSAAQFKATVAQYNLADQVIFPGLITDVRNIIGLGDVGFVLSNAVETISFSCREMLAMGIPVIVSNYAGLPENINNHEDGWIVPVNDVPALTQCLSTILKQNDLAVMSWHAREKAVKNFDQRIFIDKTLTLYQDLVNGLPPERR
jgi:L-malate glycosyltransferase